MKTKLTTTESSQKPVLYKKGIFNETEYIVIGIKKKEDGSGFSLEFIDKDPNNPNGKTIGKIFIASPMAKTLGRAFLDQIKDEEIL